MAEIFSSKTDVLVANDARRLGVPIGQEREQLLKILTSPRHLQKVAEKARRHAAIYASLPVSGRSMIKGRFQIFSLEHGFLTVCEKQSARAFFAINEFIPSLEPGDHLTGISAPRKVELFHQI